MQPRLQRTRPSLSTQHVRDVGVRKLERRGVRHMFRPQKQPANALLQGMRHVAQVVQVCLEQEGGDVPVDFPPHRIRLQVHGNQLRSRQAKALSGDFDNAIGHGKRNADTRQNTERAVAAE